MSSVLEKRKQPSDECVSAINVANDQPIPSWTNFGEIPVLLSDAVACVIIEFCSARALLTVSLLNHERWTVPIERALGRVFQNHFPTLITSVDDLWHAHGVRPGTERRPRTFSLTKHFQEMMRLATTVVLESERWTTISCNRMKRIHRASDRRFGREKTELRERWARPRPWTCFRAASILADKWPLTRCDNEIHFGYMCSTIPGVPGGMPGHTFERRHSHRPNWCWFIHVCCICERPFMCTATAHNQYDYDACSCRKRDYALWPICKDGKQTSRREQNAHPVCSNDCQRARRRPVFY